MLIEILNNRRKVILEKWFDKIVDTYPSDSSKFFHKLNDQFSNPVGCTISEGIENIFDSLLKGMNTKEFHSILEKIIKIRAVQDFSPSQSIAIFMFLKTVIRDEIKDVNQEGQLYDELLTFESKIDTLVLIAFDVYVECRDQISELRVNEIKNRSFRLLQRANLLKEEAEA